MRQLIYFLSLTLLILSLTESAKTADDNMKKGGDQSDDVNLMEAMSRCNETFRTEMAFVQALNESGSFPDETDRTPKCFIRCILEMTDAATKDGQYDIDRSVAIVSMREDTEITPEMKACGSRTEQCKCERAYQFVKCIMEQQIKNA